MTRIGKSEVVPGGLRTIDQTLAAVDAVTVDEVHAVAQDVLDAAATLAVIGPAKALSRLSS
jgi:predicted Zn-dependent peptidase